MNVKKVGLPSVLPDNDIQYMALIFNAIESIDMNANVTVFKAIKGYVFDVLPSNTDYKKPLVNEVKRLHLLLGLEPEFSKSLEYSTSVNFTLFN